MRESERRIRAYQAVLPRMKERVIAAVSLLAVAVTTMVSATYAWYVLSQNPEVKGLQTTIAANGNLEIALATGEVITIPANSQVGDGALALVEKNITWGNLINLGDPAYGLDKITLRPAQLNTNDLLGSPLYAAKYGEDGRVEELMSDFSYTYYDSTDGVFSPKEQFKKYGVRAVSSVIYSFDGNHDTALAEASSAADKARAQVVGQLQSLAHDPALQTLVDLVGDYVSAQVTEALPGILGGGSEPEVNVSSKIEDIYKLVTTLQSVMENGAEVLAQNYNIQMLRRSNTAYVVANKFTGMELLTEEWSVLQAKLEKTYEVREGEQERYVTPKLLTDLKTLRSDYATLLADVAHLEKCRGRNDVLYRCVTSDPEKTLTIETQLNHIANTSTITIDGIPITGINMDNYSKFTGNGKKIVINDGILQRVDRFVGANVESSTLSVDVKVSIISASASGTATTSAYGKKETHTLVQEYDHALNGATNFKGDVAQAADTYGLALDFWVRTNAANTQLTLQGAPVYETRDEAVVVQINGESHALYTITYTAEGADEATTYTAYLNGTDFYEYDRATDVPGDLICAQANAETSTILTQPVQYVVGYNGVNRVWDDEDDIYLDEHSTTMGSGSCYVFYPKSADDQKQSLELLRNLKVAFIDQSGNKLGEAVMDVDNAYEQTGKVTVPLVCAITNHSITDANGNITYYITELEENTATFITALLYLDGTTLSNDQVLAAGDIQGHLNIQFGTTADLGAMNDSVLREEKCYITASMDEPTQITMDDFHSITRGEQTFMGYTKEIKVNVEGTTPTSVTAYFQREINSTQGVRQGRIDFVKQDDGSWIGTYDFTTAGNYILREVLLDGISYELDQEPLTFTIEGYTIRNFFFTNGVENGRTYMTTERRFDVSMSLEFASSDREPASIKGAFIHQETGNRTTVYFTRQSAGIWTGDAALTTSGEYRLERLEIDGEPVGLPDEQVLSLNLYLGLSATVYAGNTNININDQDTINMSMILKDDSGNLLRHLTDVELEYRKHGSSITDAGLFQKMVYDPLSGMYNGTFELSGEGIYSFYRATIRVSGQSNYLNTAASAPTITALDPRPVVYWERSILGQEIFSLGDASFSITMKKVGEGGAYDNASVVAMDAVLTREGDDTLYYVRGVNNDGEIIFTLPEVNGTQEGKWTLVGVYMTNADKFSDSVDDNTYIEYRLENLYYVGSDMDPTLDEGNPAYATDDKPMYQVSEDYYNPANWWYWPLENEENPDEDLINPDAVHENDVVESVDNAYVTVVTNVDVSFDSTADIEYSGAFGQVPSFGNVAVNVSASGNPLSTYGYTVTGVKTNFVYQNNDTYLAPYGADGWTNNYGGGYTVNRQALADMLNGNPAMKTVEYKLTSTNGAQYTLSTTNSQAGTAGVYLANSITITIEDSNGNAVEMTKTVPERKIILRSTAPTVKIKTISPNGSHSSVKPARFGASNVTVNSTYSDYAATVYAEATYSWLSVTLKTEPQVTLEVSNLGQASATLNFTTTYNDGTVYMYEGANRATQTSAFKWSVGGTICKRYIGYNDAGSCDDSIAAGVLTSSSELILEWNGVQFSVPIQTITITNHRPS